MTERGKIRCVVLGGGGHASVLVECLQAEGKVEVMGVLDQDHSLWGTQVMNVPILGGDELLPGLAQGPATHFIVGLGGVGDNGPRKRLFEFGMSLGLAPLTAGHPRAILSARATIGNGSVVYPGAIVNANAVLGVNVIVNTGAIVEHDCVLEDHAHLATGAKLCSTVRVGPGAHIGAGAVIKQGMTIGEGAIVGAGAVVVKDVEPWTVVVGVPARTLKTQVGKAQVGAASSPATEGTVS